MSSEQGWQVGNGADHSAPSLAMPGLAHDAELIEALERRRSNPLRLTSMADVTPRSQPWLWESMIPADTLTVVAGPGGSHKSTLVAKLSADVTTGRVDGVLRGTPGGVIYLTTENDAATSLWPRLRAAGADMGRVHALGDRALMLPDDLELLMLQASQNDVRLIVLDPMLTFLNQQRSLQTYGRSVEVLSALMDAAARYHVTIVGITHTVKSKRKADVDSMVGSVGIGTTARQVLMVGDDDHSNKVVGVVKSNVGPTRHGWLFSVRYDPLGTDHASGRIIDAPRVELIRPAYRHEVDAMYDERGEGGTDTRVQALLTHVAERGEMTSGDAAELLMEEFHIKDRSARTIIGQAVNAGLLNRTGSGRGATLVFHLELTEAGIRLLAELGELDDSKPSKDEGTFEPFDEQEQ